MKLKDSKVYFNEFYHSYSLEDKEFHGITGVISKHLFPNKYAGIPEQILNNAARRGNEIHEKLHKSDIFHDYEPYEKFKEDNNIEIIDNEYLVTDFDHFATAIDKVGTINGQNSLIDVKTTYSLDLSYLSWQLSIGKYLFNCVNPKINIEKLYAIWVKDDTITLHEVKEVPEKYVKDLLTAEKTGAEFVNPYILQKKDSNMLSLISAITELEQQIKTLKKSKENLKSEIEKAFSAHNVEKWDNDSFVISKRKAYEREVADVNKMKEEGIFDKYKKVTNVKESINIKLK